MGFLTPSLEDYLEAIWLIGSEKKVVRVKHIADLMGVKAASVVGAIKVLSEKGLVEHERYGYVELTDEGAKAAEKVAERHGALFRFLHRILGVEEAIAKSDACNMEHHISQKTLARLIRFIEFVEEHPGGDPLWLSSFRYFAEAGKRPEGCLRKIEKAQEALPLSELKPGEYGVVVAIEGTDDVKGRLLKKGLASGINFRVDSVSEDGNHMYILLGDTRLSLQRNEARGVKVEREIKHVRGESGSDETG